MSEIHSFGVEPITSHAFNASKDKLAISPNNNEVHIYHKQNGKWSLNSTLSQHDLRVTSVDWAKNSNRIVTCSADRNAYVWSLIDGDWKPTLVLLRINRAATCVRWSPKEDKFAVGCGAKLISVCYFEEQNDWWVSKHIKKPIRSTVTAIDWHPNNILLACGSTDFRTRIFSAYIRDVDKKSQNDANTAWGGKIDSGSLVVDFPSSQGGGGWVHSVAFSPDGTRLAWVSHDSSISIVDSRKSMHPINVRTRYLPFLSCIWSSDNLIVAAGHDCCPMLYYYDDYSDEIRFIDKIDKSMKKEADGFSAMRKFRDLDKRAVVEGTVSNTALDTIHQNTISEVRLYSDYDSKQRKVEKISSVGVDGQMVIWDLKTLESSLANMNIK